MYTKNVHKTFSFNFVNLYRFTIIGIALVFFHLLAPHSYAAGWTQLGLNNTLVNSLAVDPTNANTLYAVAPRVGIFKSTDGGTTWNPINNGLVNPQYHPYYDIAIDPVNPSVLYVVSRGTATNDPQYLPGVFRSTDAGANWTNISANVPVDYPAFENIAIDPNNHNTVYIGSANHCNGVWKTTDGGTTWTYGNVPFCDITALTVNPVNSDVYVGTPNEFNVAYFFKSADGGATWTSQDVDNSGIASIAVDPNNSSILYAAADQHVYKSTDEATT